MVNSVSVSPKVNGPVIAATTWCAVVDKEGLQNAAIEADEKILESVVVRIYDTLVRGLRFITDATQPIAH